MSGAQGEDEPHLTMIESSEHSYMYLSSVNLFIIILEHYLF